MKLFLSIRPSHIPIRLNKWSVAPGAFVYFYNVVLKLVDVLSFAFLGDNLLDDTGLALGFGLGNGPDLSALPIESHRAISMALLKPLQMPL